MRGIGGAGWRGEIKGARESRVEREIKGERESRVEREIMGERGSMVEREINREKVRVEYGREMKKTGGLGPPGIEE
ncbi:hypothetical protein [Paenibacillus sp. J22TS3]|uniref:hypothetical protein n=1 Tax=Paenibacillus sp. J22TS3 TaxID=2807192 RepID=UPI001BCF520A|nr:hypothetical protein [Paenibacillus sp. J22TS3]